MTLRVIDIETTGTDPAEHSIIEIASVDLKSDGTICNHQTDLIAPGRDIPPESSAVHHLIASDFATAPQLSDVIPHYEGADAYVAHNCSFERLFLDKHFGSPAWVFTYKAALRVWPDAPGHSNQTLRYWLGLIEPFVNPRATILPHRALSDAIVTAAILAELLKLAKWPDLVAWTAEPPLITVCRFGAKHKGKRFDAISRTDPSYLTWIIEKSDLDADTKWNAAFWLKHPAAA